MHKPANLGVSLLGFLSLLCHAENGRADGQSCTLGQLNQPTRLRREGVTVNDPNQNYVHRWFLLYVPTYYKSTAPLPLWILAPGAFNPPDKQIRMSELVRYAEEQQFAFVALKGVQNLMNVFLKGQSRHGSENADDVAYTRAVIEKMQKEFCVDSRRVFCLGYSRGARFCSRLASELSPLIAAIAPVSGLRFPEPPNATRPVPIITFHGTRDPVNPFLGGADPRANHEYWDDPVEVAVSKWVRFNNCTRELTYNHSANVVVHRHTDCREGADVVFVRISGGGHTWPGSMFNWSRSLGVVTHEVNANVLLGSFFKEHPLPLHRGEAPAPHKGVSGVSAVIWTGLGLAAGVLIATCVSCFLRSGVFSEEEEECSETDSDDWNEQRLS